MYKFITILLLLSTVRFASGSLVAFELLNDSTIYSRLDGQPFGSVTNSGIIATLTASEGVLNRTSTGFGVNDSGSDDTDALNLGQYIDISFNQAVAFKHVNVSSWGTGSAGDVRLGVSTFISQGEITESGDTAYDFEVDYGETVRIIATGETAADNGFSLDSFSVEAIPEPAVIGFVVLVGIGGLAARRMLE